MHTKSKIRVNQEWLTVIDVGIWCDDADMSFVLMCYSDYQMMFHFWNPVSWELVTYLGWHCS